MDTWLSTRHYRCTVLWEKIFWLIKGHSTTEILFKVPCDLLLKDIRVKMESEFNSCFIRLIMIYKNQVSQRSFDGCLTWSFLDVYRYFVLNLRSVIPYYLWGTISPSVLDFLLKWVGLIYRRKKVRDGVVYFFPLIHLSVCGSG